MAGFSIYNAVQGSIWPAVRGLQVVPLSWLTGSEAHCQGVEQRPLLPYWNQYCTMWTVILFCILKCLVQFGIHVYMPHGKYTDYSAEMSATLSIWETESKRDGDTNIYFRMIKRNRWLPVPDIIV